MDALTFATSQKEESDFAAERRWESEGGNPGELQQALCDDRKEDATTAAKHAEGILLPRLTPHASNPIPRNNARC